MNEERYPDIEVYLAPLNIRVLNEWLKQRLHVELTSAGKRQWAGTGLSEQKQPLPVLLMESVADSFASLWIDSPDSPWARDIDLARDLNAALGVEVRCSLGGWHPGDAPDRFFRIACDGSEGVMEWPDHHAG
ncbi:hypothetical protein [Carnimonas nigrificans]|uniref:hypothetical protein n=1 Tax=Carnimonas nigrificans TaxID=64323 RepID=UPI00047296EF|nr:hypothetical protein [Carnimonas nigrificans]